MSGKSKNITRLKLLSGIVRCGSASSRSDKIVQGSRGHRKQLFRTCVQHVRIPEHSSKASGVKISTLINNKSCPDYYTQSAENIAPYMLCIITAGRMYEFCGRNTKYHWSDWQIYLTTRRAPLQPVLRSFAWALQVVLVNDIGPVYISTGIS